jgi:hypothetical protein
VAHPLLNLKLGNLVGREIMVAIASFFIALIQSLAMASDVQECSTDIQFQDNIMRVCLANENGKSVLVVSRYLGSGEIAEEKIPITTSVIAKGLDDSELVKAKNFVKSPYIITK